MGIKVEKGYPLPKMREKWGAAAKIFEEMSPGDSFVLPTKKAVSCYQSAKRKGIQVTIAKESEISSSVWLVKRAKK